MHLSVLAGGVLGGSMDGQALLCEYIKILLVNLAPDGAGNPTFIADLQRKCQVPADPQEICLLLGCLSDVLTTNEYSSHALFKR